MQLPKFVRPWVTVIPLPGGGGLAVFCMLIHVVTSVTWAAVRAGPSCAPFVSSGLEDAGDVTRPGKAVICAYAAAGDEPR